MTFPSELPLLIERFSENLESYKSGRYNETQLRREFVDPFFKALGWDVDNTRGYAEAYKEVIHEDSLKIGANTKAPDYAFRIGAERKFFLEAKKPSVNIRDDQHPAYQLRRYAWSAKLPLSILTDFEEFAVYDCTVKPKKGDRASVARVMYFTFDEYLNKWDEIRSIFARDSILKGSFDKYAADQNKKRGTATVDNVFLEEIESWRTLLAKNIILRNRELSVRELNIAVQRTIDRIVFLRIAEDRGIEPYGRLQSLQTGKNVYKRLCGYFEQADARYNSGLFHINDDGQNHETLDTFTLALSIDDKVLGQIISRLYYPDSPYEFSVLPADILGQVYERFLGKVIKLTGRTAVVEEKPEVKKAGGVYYTPNYIVEYIVRQTVINSLKDKSLSQVAGLDKRVKDPFPFRVLDPACGSGSFLIVAYQALLDWHLKKYLADEPEKHARGRDPKIHQVGARDWKLTISERRRILLTHIYGVDVDSQAVEVTKLSLLLKVLEGESSDQIARQMDFFNMRALPDLVNNIRCGNSLIPSSFYHNIPPSLFNDDDQFRINAFDWEAEFPFLVKETGFSAVVGNPPWISLTGKFGNDILSKHERDFLIHEYAGNTYMPNMYEYFISKGLKLMRPGGVFSFIVPDRFGFNDQFIKLRRVALSNYRFEEILYRAPFPNVTADTAVFRIANETPRPDDMTIIGEFFGDRRQVIVKDILEDHKAKLEFIGDNQASDIISRMSTIRGAEPLSKVVNTTSGVGAKSETLMRQRNSHSQMEMLKGESIDRYSVRYSFYFEWSRANITGRTTDINKLGFSPKILIRKTGTSIVAAFDDSGRYPEQSLYFTFGDYGEDPYYLLGLLNSRLMSYYYYHKVLTNKASMAQAKKSDLDGLPIMRTGTSPVADALILSIAECAKRITQKTERLPQLNLEQERVLAHRSINSDLTTIEATTSKLYELSTDEASLIADWRPENTSNKSE